MPTPPASMTHLLNGRRYATLSTHNEDGSAHLTPTWFLFDEGRFYINALASDRKSRNAASRPDATIMVESRELGSEGWVYASGPVEILNGDQAQEINEKIARRYLTDAGLGDPTVGPLFQASSDITICLTPTVWRSWSLRDLDDLYFGGILGSTPGMWFQPTER